MAALITLRQGSRGPQVELLQLALNNAGTNAGNTDGIFGQNTLNALLRFQTLNGLTPDGIVGSLTWNALTPYITAYLPYRIRSGDTLYNIAVRYGITLRMLEIANPNIDPFNLREGSIINVPLDQPVVPTGISFTSTVLEFVVRGLTARYPFITAGSIGSSVMGKSLYSLTMGSGDNEVFLNASHHANEWITTPVLLKFLEDYAEAYAFGGTIEGLDAGELFRRTTLYIVPMVNPDGVDLVTGELSSGPRYTSARRIAANYPSISFPSGWKANIVGTDPNLQYPAGWEEAREIKFAQGFTSPAPRDYVGPSALSAPESRSVYNFTLAHNFSITLSYHTQGEVIFWKYLDIEPPGAFEIAQAFSEASGYSMEPTPYASGYAGYKDWFILSYNRPGYTIEAGLGTSPLPSTQFDSIYRANRPMLALSLVAT